MLFSKAYRCTCNLQKNGGCGGGRSRGRGEGPATSSGKQVKYTRNKLNIKGYIHAFSANKKCKYAFCDGCLTIKAEAAGTTRRGQA